MDKSELSERIEKMKDVYTSIRGFNKFNPFYLDKQSTLDLAILRVIANSQLKASLKNEHQTESYKELEKKASKISNALIKKGFKHETVDPYNYMNTSDSANLILMENGLIYTGLTANDTSIALEFWEALTPPENIIKLENKDLSKSLIFINIANKPFFEFKDTSLRIQNIDHLKVALIDKETGITNVVSKLNMAFAASLLANLDYAFDSRAISYNPFLSTTDRFIKGLTPSSSKKLNNSMTELAGDQSLFRNYMSLLVKSPRELLLFFGVWAKMSETKHLIAEDLDQNLKYIKQTICKMTDDQEIIKCFEHYELFQDLDLFIAETTGNLNKIETEYDSLIGLSL